MRFFTVLGFILVGFGLLALFAYPASFGEDAMFLLAGLVMLSVTYTGKAIMKQSGEQPPRTKE